MPPIPSLRDETKLFHHHFASVADIDTSLRGLHLDTLYVVEVIVSPIGVDAVDACSDARNAFDGDALAGRVTQ